MGTSRQSSARSYLCHNSCHNSCSEFMQIRGTHAMQTTRTAMKQTNNMQLNNYHMTGRTPLPRQPCFREHPSRVFCVSCHRSVIQLLCVSTTVLRYYSLTCKEAVLPYPGVNKKPFACFFITNSFRTQRDWIDSFFFRCASISRLYPCE